MKTRVPTTDCRLPIDFENEAARPSSTQNPKSKIQKHSAFTLIELLIVISIIAILASFTLLVSGSVKQRAIKNRAQAELEVIKIAIERYKDAYGFYPPGSTNTVNDVPINQLYYELEGTTNSGVNYTTLDNLAQISTTTINTAFGIGGFMNCTKANAGDDSRAARTFLPELKATQIGTVLVNGVWVTNLITSVDGPLASYQPVNSPGVNPWRYICPGINNPNSYDLWVQIVFKPGQTNLICNWSSKVQINTSLP